MVLQYNTEAMKFSLSLLLAFSFLTLAESWVSPGRVSGVGNKLSTADAARSRSSFPLKDVVNGDMQWYAGSSAGTTSNPSNNVSKSAVNRKLKNAAERFIKFQSGYFSPMMPNDNNVELNRRDNINNGYYSNGYSNNNGYNNNGYSNNGYGKNGNFNNGYSNGSLNTLDSSNILAEDFVFRSPMIGPLNKWDFIESLDYFRIYEAFPDINPNCYGFAVDPLEPLKVRFFVKATGTYQKPLGGFLGSTAAKLSPPDGRQYMGSTEAWSITFNDFDRMQVKSLTAGYVVDRSEQERRLSTTKGKTLVHGMLSTIGLDLPEGVSMKIYQGLVDQLSNDNGKDRLFPKMASDRRDFPQWWNDKVDFRNGNFRNGNYLNGNNRNGNYLNGSTRNGNFLNGSTRNGNGGNYLNGSTRNGNSGNYLNGSTRNGNYLNGSSSNGNYRNNNMNNGNFRQGNAQNGNVRNGYVQNGNTRNGYR